MIYCYGEQALFPESEFVHKEDGKIFEPRIHRAHPEHYAASGMLVNWENIHGYDPVEGIVKEGSFTRVSLPGPNPKQPDPTRSNPKQPKGSVIPGLPIRDPEKDKK